MNEFKVIIYKKNGSKSFTGNKIELKESLIDIQINKKEDTSVSQATIKFQYEFVDLANFAGGDKGIVDNFAKIEIYINNKIQFTGVIKRYAKDTKTKIFTLFCHDMYYRMNNKSRKKLTWKKTKASAIVNDICSLAGVPFKFLGGEDYIVKNLEVDVGTQFHDIVSNLVETMHSRIRCSKDGIILLEYQYPPYDEKYHEKNHYDFYYKSDINLEQDNNSCRDATQMHNFLKISCDGSWVLFEDQNMTKYLNGEEWLEEFENPLATNEQLKMKVAGQKFLDMWRESTGITVQNCEGNEDIDLGKVVKLVSQDYSGYYLIIGIDTNITSERYNDVIQLRGMRDATKVYLNCKKVSHYNMPKKTETHIMLKTEKYDKEKEFQKALEKAKELKKQQGK